MAMDWNTLLCTERPRKSTNPPGDARAEFERDYDRTIFSSPVKRLQDKAQVFPLDPNDAVRTRLTHSLEVSAVSRGLGIAIGQWLLEEKIIELGMERSIEAICSTCGLVHDLGNPPFGHSGEDAIRYWFGTRFDKKTRELHKKLSDDEQLAQDFLNFEGNAQSLRLLTKLQILADFNGLNLTYGTLSASCKYIAPSHQVDKKENHAKAKPGYFASENQVVDTIRKKTGTGFARNPLTYLVEAADDMVYSVADIEDAIKKGIVSWPEIKHLLESDDASQTEAVDRMEYILKAGKDQIPTGLTDDIYASAFRTASINVGVRSVIQAFKSNYEKIMDGEYTSELAKDCDARSLIKKLKQIGQEQVYCTPSNLKLELMGRKVICDLMDIFWEGAESIPIDGHPNSKKFEGKAGALLSRNYRRVFHQSVKDLPELPETYHRLQLVTDYVCGMTDSFAKRLHTELMNG
ncbi:MAG: dGTP triphosphohydrolase [Phycisphaerales bacterium JB047]